MQMKDEILKAIEANLPTMVSGELKTYLDKAEQNQERLEELEDEHKATLETLGKEKDKNKELSDQNTAYKVISDAWVAKEESVSKREKNIYIKEKETEVASAQRVIEVYEKVMSLIFSNTVVKEKVTRSVAVKSGGYMGYDNAGHYVPLDGGESINTVEDGKVITKE